MVEYYKTKKNYYYKKTKNSNKRISKEQFIKLTNKGGFIRIQHTGGNDGKHDNCNSCTNKIDIITLDPIKNFNKNDIDNFSFIEDNKCWCFKVYDLYKMIFVSDLPIKKDQIESNIKFNINPFTNVPIPLTTIEELSKKYNEWTTSKGITNTITHNGVRFSRKDLYNIIEEYRVYLDDRRKINISEKKTPIKIFMSFTEILIQLSKNLNSNSNNSNSNSNNSNSNSNNSNSNSNNSYLNNNNYIGELSFNMKIKKLKAIIDYIRVNKRYLLN